MSEGTPSSPLTAMAPACFSEAMNEGRISGDQLPKRDRSRGKDEAERSAEWGDLERDAAEHSISMAQRPIQNDQPHDAVELAEQKIIDEITVAIALLARSSPAISRVSVVSRHWSWRVATAAWQAAQQHGIQVAVEGGDHSGSVTVTFQRACQAGDGPQRFVAAISPVLPPGLPWADDPRGSRHGARRHLAAG